MDFNTWGRILDTSRPYRTAWMSLLLFLRRLLYESIYTTDSLTASRHSRSLTLPGPPSQTCNAQLAVPRCQRLPSSTRNPTSAVHILRFPQMPVSLNSKLPQRFKAPYLFRRPSSSFLPHDLTITPPSAMTSSSTTLSRPLLACASVALPSPATL